MRAIATLALGVSISGALALSGCKNQPDQPKTSEEVIAAADKLVKPLPGLYRSKAEVVEFEIPGIPPQQAARMRDATAGLGSEATTQCLTQVQADEGFRRVVRQFGEGREGVKCDFTRFEADGNDLDAALACTGQQGVDVDMTIDGTIEPERSEMTMAMSQRASAIPGGEMRMKMRVTSERIGDCK